MASGPLDLFPMIALLAAAAASRTRRSTLKLRNVKDGGLEAVLSLPRA